MSARYRTGHARHLLLMVAIYFDRLWRRRRRRGLDIEEEPITVGLHAVVHGLLHGSLRTVVPTHQRIVSKILDQRNAHRARRTAVPPATPTPGRSPLAGCSPLPHRR